MSLGDIYWFNLGSAEKLQNAPKRETLKEVQSLLLGKIYRIFEEKIQVSHLQFHHYCQPRQNESMQGRRQFDEKNRLTLEPVIKELEELYINTVGGLNRSYIYLHIADANLDELIYRRTDLLHRLQNLCQTGYVKIGGGNLDEAFIGPDSIEFSTATIINYYNKCVQLFGEDSIAPVVWIPERFFEQRTAEVIEQVYKNYPIIKKNGYISIIVDENVIKHSLPKGWNGNLFTGWVNPRYPSVKIFVSSNKLRAIMPQASPAEINEYFFQLMSESFSDRDKQDLVWFVQTYEDLINQYDRINNSDQDNEISELKLNIDRFFIRALSRFQRNVPLCVYFVDDLEKNGSWTGSSEVAFGENRHFYHYIKQAENIFNPYNMSRLSGYRQGYQAINKINPSSYQEFSIIWNNKAEDVEKWRQLTLFFMSNDIHSLDAIKRLSKEDLDRLGISRTKTKWYLDFVRTPISWQKGQFSKYPEIKLNYILAQLVFEEILETETLDMHEYSAALMDDGSVLGHLLHIWNKNRASCPNFIGFFGGASILFFRLLVAFQLSVILSLKYYNEDSFEKELMTGIDGEELRWTFLKVRSTIKIFDENGDCVVCFDTKNFHNLASGFVRHREGYNSIIKKILDGRADITNFALVEKEGGTASSHPLVVALDLDKVEKIETLRKTYPEDLNIFDDEIEVVSQYPAAWEQVWLLSDDTVDSPLDNYLSGDMSGLKYLHTRKYQDHEQNQRLITFVRKAEYNGNKIDVVKKVNTEKMSTKIEIWNRATQSISFNPLIVFPTTLDWYEGQNYSVEGQVLPLNGAIKQFDKSSIIIKDKISNLKLTFNCYRQDIKYNLTTAYTYQTSDNGAYTVSPQHEMIAISSNHVVRLNPGESYIIEYAIQNDPLTNDSLWKVDWDSVPILLKKKIERFSELFFKGKNLTQFQKVKLIYARYPEIIFWVR